MWWRRLAPPLLRALRLSAYIGQLTAWLGCCFVFRDSWLMVPGRLRCCLLWRDTGCRGVPTFHWVVLWLCCLLCKQAARSVRAVPAVRGGPTRRGLGMAALLQGSQLFMRLWRSLEQLQAVSQKEWCSGTNITARFLLAPLRRGASARGVSKRRFYIRETWAEPRAFSCCLAGRSPPPSE
jgi:hypothetical protein